jgi:glycosyl transferase family 87
MASFFRERTRLWAVAGLWTGVLLTAFNLYAAFVTYIPQYRVRNDFRLMYGAALDAWQNGYGHLYDLGSQKAAVESLGAYWSPFINPPPLAWLATPFLLAPFDIAVVLWTVLVVGAAYFAWRVVSPGAGLVRLAHLALFLGLFPTAYGLLVGQPVALVAAVVSGSWWLAEKKRPVAAGVVLSLIAIKPQLALLVPLCLLVAGQSRMFIAWLAATAVIGVATLALLGADGLQRYRDALALASQWEPTRRYAIAGPLGLGPQVYAVELVVLAVAVYAAWRQRGSGASRPIATGLVASLLFTPYVGFQDFAMLVLAGWLVIRSGVTAFQTVLLVVGYALLELALVVLAVPILATEALLLLSLAWPAAQAPGDLRGMRRIVRSDVADNTGDRDLAERAQRA